MPADMKNDKIEPDARVLIKKSKSSSEKVNSFKGEQATITVQHPDGTIEKRTI